VISASAKGVLMIPEDTIPEGMSPEDFAEEWTKINGVIVYKPSSKHQQLPTQVSANSTNVGIKDLLNVQMQMMQEVSGVHGAIQGADAKSGTPSSLYAQQAQNASMNSKDYFAFFNHFKEKRDTKVLKVITQFYKEPRYLAVSGMSYQEQAKEYDPDRVKNIDFDVMVSEGQDTPLFRQLIDDMLIKLLEAQQIDVEMFLEHTTLPFGETILESIRQKKEQIETGQTQGGASQELTEGLQKQLKDQSNPEASKMVERALGRNQK